MFLQLCFTDHFIYGHPNCTAATVCHLKQTLIPQKKVLREEQGKSYIGTSVWILTCSNTTSAHLIFYLLFCGLIFWE